MSIKSKIVSAIAALTLGSAAAADVRIATFQADVTPPIGSPLCHGNVSNVVTIVDPLTARGVVLLAAKQKPVVLCAVDWVANSNAGYDEWRKALAEAAGTNKMTLYRHFASKDELVAEYLRQSAALADACWERFQTAHPDDAQAQLRAWLVEMAEHVASNDERGCPLANAAV